MAFVKSEDNNKYEDLLKQVGKCDSIAYNIKVVRLIIECGSLTTKQIEDKLSTLETNYTTEITKLETDKKLYNDSKDTQKDKITKLNKTKKVK